MCYTGECPYEHGNAIGWTGGEVPEHGHPCKFNAMNDDGFPVCASHGTIIRLRTENEKMRELLLDYYNATCTTCDPWSETFSCEHNECGNCLLAIRTLELGIGGE